MSITTWNCPYCNAYSTIREEDRFEKKFSANKKYPAKEEFTMISITCPNPECKKETFKLEQYGYNIPTSYWIPTGKKINEWQILPKNNVKALSEVVPEDIKKSFQEASLTIDLSPSSAALLARRCLRYLIKDIWKVDKTSLNKQLSAIQKKMDPVTWAFIELAVKDGNISDLFNENTDSFVEVDSKCAKTLLHIVDVFIDDFYLTKDTNRKKLLKTLALV